MSIYTTTALVSQGWSEVAGSFREPVKHHMGRRCLNWDYSARCIYMVTITQEDRSRPLLGTLVRRGPEEWAVEPSEAGRAVEECWREIPVQWPGVEVIAWQVMPDHFHGILFVREPLPKGKTLGNVVGSFKSKSASRVLNSARGGAPNSLRPGAATSGAVQRPAACGGGAAKLWAAGYVDTILFRRGQLEKMVEYIRDNPRRLGVKRDHPELFRVLRDLQVELGRTRAGAETHATGCRTCGGEPGGARAIGHFSAIGNHFLLDAPVMHQVQCSRSDFEYAREALKPCRTRQGAEPAAGRGTRWRILRDAQGVPVVAKTTPAFEAKAEAALAAAAHGAVLISPAISHGEREIARRAYAAGHPVIVLRNKGFSPLYKPGGKLFEPCAAGNLLLLAPAGWPYVPGEKPPTRESSLVLNRIAQLIAGEDAAEIDYKGATLRDVDALVAAAIDSPARGRAQNPRGRAQDPRGRAQDPRGRAQDPHDRAQNPRGGAPEQKGEEP